MHKNDINKSAQSQTEAVRPLARKLARELSAEEMAMVAGARPLHTHATGANGDDPSDPGFAF